MALTDEQFKEARALYERNDGMGYKAVGERFGVSKDTIYRRAKREGWTKRHTREIAAKTREKAQEKIVERESERIAEFHKRLLKGGMNLYDIFEAEIARLEKSIATVKEGKAKADIKRLRPIVSSYKDLVGVIHLQTGKPTSITEGINETYEERITRLARERENRKKK